MVNAARFSIPANYLFFKALAGSDVVVIASVVVVALIGRHG